MMPPDRRSGSDRRSEGERLATVETEVNGVKEAIAELKADMHALRGSLITFALSVTGSAVVIAVSFVLTRH